MNILFVDPSLRSTGVFAIINNKRESYTLVTICDHIAALGEIASHFTRTAKDFDALVIEDYAFGKASQSVSKNAEVGGIIRGTFAIDGKPIIEMPISTWKNITGVRLKKASAKDKRFYIETVSTLADRNFDSTDACDAWLIYWSSKRILEERNLQTDAQKRLKDDFHKAKIVFSDLEDFGA